VNSEEENIKRVMERVKVNDPAALTHMGSRCGREGDYDGALEYCTKAAELGHPIAHYSLGII
jgi:TPR repeat protein